MNKYMDKYMGQTYVYNFNFKRWEVGEILMVLIFEQTSKNMEIYIRISKLMQF